MASESQVSFSLIIPARKQKAGRALLVLSPLDDETVPLEGAQLLCSHSCVPAASVLPVGRAAGPGSGSRCLRCKFKFVPCHKDGSPRSMSVHFTIPKAVRFCTDVLTLGKFSNQFISGTS